ncbi:MAG: NAD(P)-dependent oxidoreductase [Pseudomonadota bacterium]
MLKGASAMAVKTAFLGLGVMGFPMAGHLAAAGHDVVVYNRTAAKADKWTKTHKGAAAPTPAIAAQDADIVFACVGADDDLHAVTLGENGAFAAMKNDAIFVDHTTTSAEIARTLHGEARERGLHFVDAPVSGGQAGAENGALTVMIGGDDEPVARADAVIAAYAKQSRHMGPSGAGQLTKMVNQICIAGLVQGLSEALNFAMASGLDAKAAADVISGGAAQSWQMDNRAKTMIDGEFDFGFAVDWMRKDLGLVLDEARANGSPLPVTALVDQFYKDVQAMGGGRWDTSSLIARLNASFTEG